MLPPELIEEMQRHKIEINVTPSGLALLTAPNEPPAELVEKIERYSSHTVEYGYISNRLCGGCKFWSSSAEWGRLMGTCSRPARAFEGGRPLAIHAACVCSAYGGQGFKSKNQAVNELEKPA